MKISDIPLNNRPRERLQRLGAKALSEAELLAIILQKGTKNENVIDMSNRLLSKHSLGKLSELSLTELQEINGIGPAKAMQIKALFELNNRFHLSLREGKPIITEDIITYTKLLCLPNIVDALVIQKLMASTINQQKMFLNMLPSAYCPMIRSNF